jgi:NADPH:quinone reductase-like Zn-dependent oxidoreductase
MSSNHAVIVDPSVAGRLIISDVDYPLAAPSEAIVRVKAISLNRGEVRTASNAEAGWRPGWDLAGVVETEVTFDLRHFFLLGGATLYGFIIFHELKRKSVTEGLGRLGRLVADGRLRPQIDVEASWTQVGDVAQRLLNRSFTGKAVLHIAN